MRLAADAFWMRERGRLVIDQYRKPNVVRGFC